MTKSSHNVVKLPKCVQNLVSRIRINMNKLLLARGNWIIYNRLPIGICLYLNTLSSDMSITILLKSTGLQLSITNFYL